MKLIVKGLTYEIGVTQEGKFFIQDDLDHLSDNTLDGLRKKILKRTNKKEFNIPIVYVGGGWGNDDTIQCVTATGIHDRTNSLLVKHRDGEPDTISIHASRRVLDLTYAELNKLKRLQAAKLKAEKAFDDFLCEKKFDWDRVKS